jgi:Amt family ammonium transporter
MHRLRFALCLFLLLALITPGFAAEDMGGAAGETATATAEDLTLLETALQNKMNILWTCVAAFLVFFMQAGFAMVEAGFTRAKNACNIMMKNLMDFSIGTLGWWVLGFGLMFGAGGAFIGGSHFAASDFSETDLNWAFWIFQCVFAGTAATIVSGAMAGRTKFIGYLCYSVVICAVIYPISGHWFWASLFGPSTGWGENMGFVDFAGSTVVHSCGAWLALAGAITLGPRLGKYTNGGDSNAIPGHSIPLGALGVFILWFGWFGFNPGSTTTADASIGYIAMTTNLAAAAGAIFAMIASWVRFGKPDVSMALNGVLAGLVAITAGCADVTPFGAVVIGAVAGVLVVVAVEFIDKVLKIDDPVGAVSVHGVCGAWGTVALCFFLKEGSSASLGVQLAGVAAMFAWAFGTGMILFNLIKYTVGLRVSRDEELRGLDIDEHGNEAYPNFQVFVTQ